MKLLKLLTLFALNMTMAVSHASGGMQLDRSRIVIENGQTNGSYALTNYYKQPLLVSAGISNFDGSRTNIFAPSPSIYQIKPESTYQAKVIQIEALPQDRESVFWLNLRTALGQQTNSSENVNSMEISIGQSIKIFYRPKGINQKCEEVAKSLQWMKTADGIRAKNDEKISVSLVKIESNNQVQSIGDTLLPLSEKEWKLNIKLSKEMTFTYVDEFGNLLDQKVVLK